MTLTYDEIGNIMSKSDQGLYTYGAGHPHEPVSIGGTGYAYDANGNRVSAGSETYTWTAFNKPVAITDSDSDVTTTFAYAPDRSHYKQTITSSGTTTTIRYVGQRFKTVTSGGVTTYKHQITANGRVIAVYADTDNNTEELGYLHYDANGSLLAVTDMTGTVISRQHYDAYGQAQSMMGDTGDTTNIGFDSHEQLASGLIHMGGRIYDPATGQFTSADPFIQAPFVSKSLNRTSFAWNNPLRYVDINGFTAAIGAGNGDSCGFIDAVFTHCSGGGGGGGGGGGPSSDWLTSIGSGGYHSSGVSGYMPSGVNLSSPSAEQLNGIFSGNGSSSGSLLTAPASQFFVEKNGFPTYWPSNHLSDPGDAFLTFYDAAYAAVNKYNPLSVSQNLEYGGLVYQQGAHGLYSYTVPDIGTADQVNAFSAVQQFEVPAGAHVVADWHTHAGQSIFYDNEHFSPADIRGSNAVKRIDFPDYRGRFLGTPSGNFLFWPYGRAPGKPAIDLGSVSN